MFSGRFTLISRTRALPKCGQTTCESRPASGQTRPAGAQGKRREWMVRKSS